MTKGEIKRTKRKLGQVSSLSRAIKGPRAKRKDIRECKIEERIHEISII